MLSLFLHFTSFHSFVRHAAAFFSEMPRIPASKFVRSLLFLDFSTTVCQSGHVFFFYHLWTDGVWRCLAIGGSSVEVSCGSCGSARLMNELLLAAAEVDTERQKIRQFAVRHALSQDDAVPPVLVSRLASQLKNRQGAWKCSEVFGSVRRC
jgi:hypothetical protein